MCSGFARLIPLVAKVNPKRSRQRLPSSCLTMPVSSPVWLFQLMAVQLQVFRHTKQPASGRWKAMGVGGVRQDFEFQSWLLRLGVRYLTGGSDVGYILSAGRADVKQLRELKLG